MKKEKASKPLYKCIDQDKKRNPSEISRRQFISGTMSMAVVSGLGIFKPLDSIENNEGIKIKVAAAPVIIDTHTHFYDPFRPVPAGRKDPISWPAPKSNLYRAVMPPIWLALASPLGMKGTVVVEASSWLEDNYWILNLAEKYKYLVGFIGNLSGTTIVKGAEVSVWDDMKRYKKELKKLSKNPVFRGIRVGGRSVSGDLKEGKYPHFKLLADAGLVLDVLNVPASDIVSLAKALPSLIIVVDHMLVIRGTASPSAQWHSDIQAIAEPKNVVMKVSGLVEGFDSKETDVIRALEMSRGALDHVFKYFGPERLIFGTNWPVSEPKGEMDVVTGIIRKYFESKGEKILADVFSGNAKKYYKYPDR